MLKSHFGENGPPTYMWYKPKSNKEWLPKDIHHSIKTFIESVDKDLQEPNKNHQKFTKNLTKGEIKSL